MEDSNIWQYIEKNIRDICRSYNANEIRTPVFEATELYSRGVGDETDIVNKEMYTFLDKGDRSITLRPELTAGVVRAYIENGLGSVVSPLKLWYIGNMYRYEKMQKGRYREFTQFGLEIFGSDSYLADIETIALSYDVLKSINVADKVDLSINSIGCSECRPKYVAKLKEYIKPHLDEMCDTCKIRYEKNPLRMIDCKEDKCKVILANAPMITDNLCEECSNDFNKLKNMLESINIPYVIDKKIVRGLDYYNKTVYEYISRDLDIAIGGGGRYDKLVSILGGNETPAVGFALGMDRIVLLLKELNKVSELKQNTDIYFCILTPNGYAKARNLINNLRNDNFVVEMDISERSFKSQLKYADKLNSRYVCIIGEDEIKNNECILKDMNSGTQQNVSLESNELIKLLR